VSDDHDDPGGAASPPGVHRAAELIGDGLTLLRAALDAGPSAARSVVAASDLDEVDLVILRLLLDGVVAKTIPAQAGVSRWSYDNRLTAMKARAGARSMFQLGAAAAERGWLAAARATAPSPAGRSTGRSR
jgi:hypothetical protein